MKNLTDLQIKTIFQSISLGVGNHGSFLTRLALTVVAADYENFSLLRSVLIEIIQKYNLYKSQYLLEEIT